MFIVKAVEADGQYRLYECERVRVDNCAASGNPPQTSAPQRVIRMYDQSDAEFVTALYVGLSEGKGTEPGSCQYRIVYVMTADGKTVDTIRAEVPPDPLPCLSAAVPETYEELRQRARGGGG